MKLHIAYLYPDQLNIYGDRGNILTLHRRCLWRGIEVAVTPLDLGEAVDPDVYDLYFMGGGQDTQQIKVADDLLDPPPPAHPVGLPVLLRQVAQVAHHRGEPDDRRCEGGAQAGQ